MPPFPVVANMLYDGMETTESRISTLSTTRYHEPVPILTSPIVASLPLFGIVSVIWCFSFLVVFSLMPKSMRPQPTGHPIYRWAVSGTFWSAIFTFSPFIVSGVGIWLLLYCLVAHPFASLARLITGKKRKRRSRWHPAIVLNRIVFPSEEDLPSQSQTTPATETERGAAVPNYDTESQPSMSSVPDSPPQAHHAAVEPPLSPIPEQLEQAPRQPRDGSGQGDQVLAGHHPSTQPGPTLSQFDGETRDDDNRDRSVRFSGEDTVHTYPSGRSSTRLQDVSSQ